MELPFEDEAWTELQVKDVKRSFDLSKACARRDANRTAKPENDWHEMIKMIKGDVSALELGGFLENEDRISGFRPATGLGPTVKSVGTKETEEQVFEALLEQMASMGVKSSDLRQLKEGREEMKAAKSGSEKSETDPEITLPLSSGSSSRETIAYGDAGAQKQHLANVEQTWRRRVKLAKALDRELTTQLRLLCSRNMLTEIDSLSESERPTTASKMMAKIGELVMRSRTMTVEEKKRALEGLRLESFNWNYDNYQTQVLKIRDEIHGIEGSGVTEHEMCRLVMLSLRHDHKKTYNSLLDGYLGSVSDPEDGLSLMGKGGLLVRLKVRYNAELRTGGHDSEKKAFGVQMKCTHCGGAHLEAQCWKKHPEKNPHNRNHKNQQGGGKETKQCPKCGNRHDSPCGFRGKCHKCKGDHVKKMCPQNKDPPKVARLCLGPEPGDPESGDDDDEYDHLVANKAVWGKTRTNIVFDTGANSHVTPYEGSLENYRSETSAAIQGVGAEATAIAGSGVFKFGVRDHESNQIIEMELPQTAHLPGTSQPLVSCHRIHKMCRKKGWDSKSSQVCESGALEINTGHSRFRFSMKPLNGVYCFDPKDVFVTDIQPNNTPKSGELNVKDGVQHQAVRVATRSAQKSKKEAAGASAREHKTPVEKCEPVEEKKTPAEVRGPTGEFKAATEEPTAPQEREVSGEEKKENVCASLSTEGGSYAPASPGDKYGGRPLYQQRDREQPADPPREHIYCAAGPEGRAEPTRGIWPHQRPADTPRADKQWCAQCYAAGSQGSQEGGQVGLRALPQGSRPEHSYYQEDKQNCAGTRRSNVPGCERRIAEVPPRKHHRVLDWRRRNGADNAVPQEVQGCGHHPRDFARSASIHRASNRAQDEEDISPV